MTMTSLHRTAPPSGSCASAALADIIGEQALLLGAGSTVLYQLADRGTGLGVAEHSTTLMRPADRLRTTLLYVYMMIHGTDEERKQIVRMVNKAHAGVRSEGRYSAYDPELQLWVAATLAQNGMFIWERINGRLDDASRERIYRDSQIFGNALQVKPEQWPATMAEFEAYWERQLDSFVAAGPEPSVQVYVQKLLAPEMRPAGLRGLGRVQDLMSRGNVDPRIREVLGLTWTPADQRRYDLFWKVFPSLYRLTPRFLRHAAARAIIRDTRRRMRKGRRVI
ncbi:hypothetical protein GCM10011584_33800 [Nocardioides phosphati]|uniref:ER-bound oxygenase mpaB/mpaB'/Rubber oxygenase catalytic domain-containing protein n=1 Tax=Nocardioides phosphati TaxID=1867775 RepID=A0ABQ2NFU4_9ACTN|nr:oxygenase MpaB family protein [Nocardioides phosphati]GGO93937.1 hypothetical protein GCM10011584_33800 [Nocardioides phosphati]